MKISAPPLSSFVSSSPQQPHSPPHKLSPAWSQQELCEQPMFPRPVICQTLAVTKLHQHSFVPGEGTSSYWGKSEAQGSQGEGLISDGHLCPPTSLRPWCDGASLSFVHFPLSCLPEQEKDHSGRLKSMLPVFLETASFSKNVETLYL